MTSTVTSMSLDSIVRATPDQLTCELDGESVILHVRDGVYYGLDAVGTFIWNHMAVPVSVATIRDALVQRFDVEPDRCEADLLELTNSLLEHGLIVSDAP